MDEITLIEMIPKKQLKRVLEQDMCDIEEGFLGFTDIYKMLSEIIPKHFTVVDFGCAYNPQCFYFQEHKHYHAIDIFPDTERFMTSNCTFYEMKISEFIGKYLDLFDLDRTFAICSYVPPWHDDNIKIVKENFKNVFTYYPSQDLSHKITFKEQS